MLRVLPNIAASAADAIHERQQPVHIRWMIRRDMPAVMEIENASFPSPWTEDEFKRTLQDKKCIGMVAEDGEMVAGYMVYELGGHVITLLNFAVHPALRLSGIGTQLIGKLKSKLSYQRRGRIVADVSDANLPAHLFFRHLDFEAVRVLWQHDIDGGDSYRMVYRLRSGI